jgi:Peptidase family C54
MVLSQALLFLHLGKLKFIFTLSLDLLINKYLCAGRDWHWDLEQRNPKYVSILNMFEDNKSANYSIHQIALMGASSENKEVGQWFGPNTVAQVIK